MPLHLTALVLSGCPAIRDWPSWNRTAVLYDTSVPATGCRARNLTSGPARSITQGELLFGGINGFNVFDPSNVKINTHVPSVVITSIYKLNERVDLDQPIERLEEIVLDYTDYVIAFEFSALDYTAPESNDYAYMLEGLDSDWIPFSGVRRATYTSLPAGDYVFRVRGSNNDGVWNQQGAQLMLRVPPPPLADLVGKLTLWADRCGSHLLGAECALGKIASSRSCSSNERQAGEGDCHSNRA